MDRRGAFTAFVWLATAGLFALRIGMGQDVARSVGYALAPWLVGLIVALIKMAYFRRRSGFRNSVEGAAFVLLLILYVITLLRTGM